jgi:hypothetical protein
MPGGWLGCCSTRLQLLHACSILHSCCKYALSLAYLANQGLHLTFCRFLLKLSLDPGLDWWSKLRREVQGLGG